MLDSNSREVDSPTGCPYHTEAVRAERCYNCAEPCPPTCTYKEKQFVKPTPQTDPNPCDIPYVQTDSRESPKYIQAMKDGKAPLEYLVETMDELDAAVHELGARKYGVRNWRVDHITASTYIGAMRRHLKAWASGENLDPESGKSHLSHLRACCAIVLDAEMHGTLIDNRQQAVSKSVQHVQTKE